MSINDIVDKIKNNPQDLNDIVFYDIFCARDSCESDKRNFYNNIVSEVEKRLGQDRALTLAKMIIQRV